MSRFKDNCRQGFQVRSFPWAPGGGFDARQAFLDDLMVDYAPVPPKPKFPVTEGNGYVSEWFDGSVGDKVVVEKQERVRRYRRRVMS